MKLQKPKTSEEILQKCCGETQEPNNKDRCFQSLISANAGVFYWNVTKDILEWDDNMFLMYGISRNEWGANYDSFIALLSEDDSRRITISANMSIKNNSSFTDAFQIILPSGQLKYIRAYGHAFSDENGDTIMAGLNIVIPKKEYLLKFTSDMKDVNVIQHFKARKALFNLKYMMTKAMKPIPPENNDWHTINNENMPNVTNTKWRKLSMENIGSLIVECVSTNGGADTHYHNEDELLVNIGDMPIEIWVDGEYTMLTPRDSIFIPAKTFHRCAFSGTCNYMITWFDYYESNQFYEL